MKLNNYDGKWDWGVFWLHGIIGFVVGFFLWFSLWVLVYADHITIEDLIIESSIVGVIFFLLAGFFGDKFWNKLKEYFYP
jgi:uncharacterized protein YacL